MKKLLIFSILFLLFTGIIVWFNFDWFKLVFAAGNDSNTVSLLHMNGTDGSTTFTDNASGGTHTWTANGNAQIDTAQSKFGGASGLFDGTGDYLSAPDSNDWNFGSGDFTIDFWVRFNTVSGYQKFITQYDSASSWWNIGFNMSAIDDGKLFMRFYYTDIEKGFCSTTNSTGMIANTWYHLAFVLSGSNCYFFKDGSSLAITYSTTFASPLPDFTSQLEIGRRPDLTHDFNGWLDELRVSKGIARWTANFTPPGCEYNGPCSPPPKVPDIMVFE